MTELGRTVLSPMITGLDVSTQADKSVYVVRYQQQIVYVGDTPPPIEFTVVQDPTSWRIALPEEEESK